MGGKIIYHTLLYFSLVATTIMLRSFASFDIGVGEFSVSLVLRGEGGIDVYIEYCSVAFNIR